MSQLDLAPRCSRCGRSVASDEDLLDLAERAREASRIVRDIVIPDLVKTLAREVASEMACRLSKCKGRA